MGQRHARLQVVFTNLRRAVDDVILKHQATVQELLATVGWSSRPPSAGRSSPAPCSRKRRWEAPRELPTPTGKPTARATGRRKAPPTCPTPHSSTSTTPPLSRLQPPGHDRRRRRRPLHVPHGHARRQILRLRARQPAHRPHPGAAAAGRRPLHIHSIVSARGFLPLTTQSRSGSFPSLQRGAVAQDARAPLREVAGEAIRTGRRAGERLCVQGPHAVERDGELAPPLVG